MSRLTHLDEHGAAHMVDVSAKATTARQAIASGRISMTAEARQAIAAGLVKKGDVLAVARVAGIMGAKKTSDLIPLCHPIALNRVEVDIAEENGVLVVTAIVETNDRTGVEMEAMTAASVAALTLYDMAKGIDRGMRITAVELMEKSGGKSGDYRR